MIYSVFDIDKQEGQTFTTMNDCCEVIGIHPKTLKRWQNEGKSHKTGRYIVFWSDLNKNYGKQRAGKRTNNLIHCEKGTKRGETEE